MGHERHEARRIDRQLVPLRPPGRSGLLQFFISLEDVSGVCLGSDFAIKYMEKMGWRRIRNWENRLLNRSIAAGAEKRVEQHNFQNPQRTLFEYDDV